MTPIPNDSHSCPSRPLFYLTNLSHRSWWLQAQATEMSDHSVVTHVVTTFFTIGITVTHLEVGDFWIAVSLMKTPVFQVNCEISYQDIRGMIAVFWRGGSCDITVIWIRIHVSGIRICGDLFDAHTFVPFHLNVSQTLEVLDFPCAQSRFGEQTCFRFVVKSFSGIPFPKTEEAPPGARHPVNSKW